MLYNIPIEKLEERYSADWFNYFLSEFNRLHVKYITIYPQPLTSRIQQGSFLDVAGTNYFKAMQLAEICKLLFEGKIKKGDIFFFFDLWFPGIEMLAYIRDGLDIDFKICGILHAGTYDPFDFLFQKGMFRWGANLENCWFEIFDAIFVGTQFHKELIISTRNAYPQRIHVTGLPIYPYFVKKTDRENIVVFPHRLDPEKNPKTFDKISKQLAKSYPNWKFIKSKDVCKTKQDYYDLLNKSKIAVSCADQETFGIAMIEATLCGCFPVVPNKLSYEELYNGLFKYNNHIQLVEKIETLMRTNCRMSFRKFCEDAIDTQKEKFIREGEIAIQRMIEIMRSFSPCST